MKKVAFLVLLTQLFALSFNFCFISNANGLFTYNLINGEAYITGYNDKNCKTVTIPQTLEGLTVTTICKDAFEGCVNLKSISIPDTITSIEYGAFYDTALYNDTKNWQDNSLYINNHLIEVDLKVTDFCVKDGTITIADNAFSDCGELKSVLLPQSVKTIGKKAFKDCKNLLSVVIPDNVQIIGNNAFENCKSLQSIQLSASLTYISDNLFVNCLSLKQIDIPNSVSSILQAAFLNCQILTRVTIPDSVRFIGKNVFKDCADLQSVEFIANTKSWYIDNEKISVSDIDNPLYVSQILTTVAIDKNLYGRMIVTFKDSDNNIINSTEYDYGDAVSIPQYTPPQYCTFVGWNKQIENICTKSAEYIALVEHVCVFDKNVPAQQYLKSNASCTQKALYFKSCVCGAVGEQTFESGMLLEHNYNNQIASNTYLKSKATCTQKAKYYKSCVCGANGSQIFESGAVLNHNYNNQIISANYLKSKATCTQKAVYYYSCACGAKGTQTFEYGQPTSHTPDCEPTYFNAQHCTCCGTILKDKLVYISPYEDVSSNAWFKSYVDYISAKGYIKGTDINKFSPNVKLSRGMFVTILARIAGVEVGGNVTTRFTDVKSNMYYAYAIKWASDIGIVNGISYNLFEPDYNITREQLCALIVRFAKSFNCPLTPNTTPVEFLDENLISDWARESVEICQSCQIVNGNPSNNGFLFKPLDDATRAEAAKILYVFLTAYYQK